VHKSKKFWPNAEIEILNRQPTTVSKLMESEDPEEPTYGSAWRRKPYFLTAGTLAQPRTTARRGSLVRTGLSLRVTGSFPGSFFSVVHRGILPVPLASSGTLDGSIRLARHNTIGLQLVPVVGRGARPRIKTFDLKITPRRFLCLYKSLF
jgi:hypothetical protein